MYMTILSIVRNICNKMIIKIDQGNHISYSFVK